jgi:hypothetical protein
MAIVLTVQEVYVYPFCNFLLCRSFCGHCSDPMGEKASGCHKDFFGDWKLGI